jgi:hypothetical protein
MLVLNKYAQNWKNLTIHESSPSQNSFYECLLEKCKKYSTSHYYPDKAFGEKYELSY